MSEQKWKPGDVAMVRISDDYDPEVAVRGAGVFDGKWYVGGPRLGSQHGWYEDRIEIVRPLVVIDPEDDALTEVHWRMAGESLASYRAALREFAAPTPPKPDEPLGLGAVVESISGERWVRSDPDSPTPWRISDGSAFNCPWRSIQAVRVLSEGVTP